MCKGGKWCVREAGGAEGRQVVCKGDRRFSRGADGGIVSRDEAAVLINDVAKSSSFFPTILLGPSKYYFRVTL